MRCSGKLELLHLRLECIYGKVFENQTFELWMALCERVNDFCEEFIAVADYAPVDNDGFVMVEV